MGSIYDWSLEAADNANADDAINWLEGQLPSSVNNSARAMMQRMQEFLTDIGGTLTATGTAKTLNISSCSQLISYKDGIIIRFQATLTNEEGTAIRLNNLPAKPIYKTGEKHPIPLTGGEFQPQGIYECVYNQDLADDGAWYLIGPLFTPSRPSVVSAGFVMPYCGTTAPNGWLKCDGSWLSRTEYATLFQVIGSQFGRDEGEEKFRLPDLRGEFIRGFIDGRQDIATQKGREFGAHEKEMLTSHRHGGATEHSGQHHHTENFSFTTLVSHGGYSVGSRIDTSSETMQTATDGAHSHKFTTDKGIDDDGILGQETRPRNVALLYCIKY